MGIKPFAHSAIHGVTVGIHSGNGFTLKTLPKGGCAVLHHVSPGGIFFPGQQFPGGIDIAVFRQHFYQIKGAEIAGGETHTGIDNGQNLSVYDRRINASGYTETEQILWFEFKYNSVSGTQTRWGFARGATLVIYDAETNAMIHHSATDGTVNNRQLEAGKWYRILLMPDANAQLGANREIGYAGGYYNEGNVDIYIRNVHSNDKH
jgi:hypothetical protein